jgi:rhodanese-related sulfurtransferase
VTINFWQSLREISMSKSTHRFTQARPIAANQLQSRQTELSIVDARSWLEYLTGHIPGAQIFDRDRVLADIPKDRPIAVACLSGHRSVPVAQWLVDQGYAQVYNLQGGLMAWKNAGYPVKGGNQP